MAKKRTTRHTRNKKAAGKEIPKNMNLIYLAGAVVAILIVGALLLLTFGPHPVSHPVQNLINSVQNPSGSTSTVLTSHPKQIVESANTTRALNALDNLSAPTPYVQKLTAIYTETTLINVPQYGNIAQNVSLIFEKYGNSTAMLISSPPSIYSDKNSSIYSYNINGTYYNCLSSSLLYPNSTNSTGFYCERTQKNQADFSLLLANYTITNAKLYNSTYNSMACTVISGDLNSSSTKQTVQGIVTEILTGNFSTCMSDHYHVPLTFGVNIVEQFSQGQSQSQVVTLQSGILLKNLTQNSSQSFVETLPPGSTIINGTG
jgi:hypothetical protein